jgi:leucyl-tRNA synthetase
MDPHDHDALASPEALKYWGQVDWYNGGMEHTTLHLLYSRFWHKFLYDIGVVPYSEPYAKRTSHGMILGMNPHNFDNLPEEEKNALVAQYGSEKAARKYLVEKYGEMANQQIVKMSKSLGNVVNPNDVVDTYGADTLRLYIMFIGDFEKAAPWSDTAVKGCKRFLDKVWNLCEAPKPGDVPAHEASLHRTVKKVGDDIEEMKFNTAIAAMMTLVNELGEGGANRAEVNVLLRLLSPFAPHICEELWEMNGFEGLCSMQPWPEYDESKMVESEKQIAVQVGGKLKTTVIVPTDATDEQMVAAALADEKIKHIGEGMELVRSIVVRNKLVNLIFKPKA